MGAEEVSALVLNEIKQSLEGATDEIKIKVLYKVIDILVQITEGREDQLCKIIEGEQQLRALTTVKAVQDIPAEARLNRIIDIQKDIDKAYGLLHCADMEYDLEASYWRAELEDGHDI